MSDAATSDDHNATQSHFKEVQSEKEVAAPSAAHVNDHLGATGKRDPAEVKLVRKLDRMIMVFFVLTFG